MQKLIGAVEAHRALILDAERHIWRNPETGYREWKTSRYLADAFIKLGYELTFAGDIPGFYTVIDTGVPGPELLIMGELDSIICPDHREADPVTGAVHACGHNAQCAALLGVAAALREPGVLDGLCGRIRLCAVPAEELLEMDFRSGLRRDGVIKFYGGKSEFLSRGYFDGVELAFMVHTEPEFCVKQGGVGFVAKTVTYKGTSAHAGGSPWEGRNALYAATCGLNAVNALRPTFREEDLIRIHPIITEGGAMVNAIPDRVVIEDYVRGRTFDAIFDADTKVNRALCSGALALGCNVEIDEIPGYAPLINDKNLIKLAAKAAEMILPHREFTVYDITTSSSTDMGDLSSIMPVVHPYAGGAIGKSHGADYEIADPEAACVDSVKLQLMLLTLLLGNDAAEAKRIIAEYKPTFPSKEEYLEFMAGIYSSGERIVYRDGVAEVKI